MKKITFLLLFFILRVSCVAQVSNPFDGIVSTFTVIIIQPPQNNYSLVTCSNDDGRMIYIRIPNERFNILNNKNNITLGTVGLYIPSYSPGTISLQNNQYRIEMPSFSRQYSKVNKVVKLINDPSTYFVITKRDTANGLTYFTDNQQPFYYLKLGQLVYETRYNNKRYAVLQDQHNVYITHNKELHFMTNAEYNSIPKEEVNWNVPPPPKKSDSTYLLDTLLNHPYWEYNAIASGQNSLGKIYLNAPAYAEFVVDIMLSNYNNYVSWSYNQTQSPPVLPLTESYYDVKVSGKFLKNVPLPKGYNTRIKSGTLSITGTSLWTLFDENKLNTIYSSSLPKKVEFPIGIYQLQINGTFHQVEIKDGETLNYIDSSQTTQRLNTNAPDNKFIKPELSNIIPIENGYESVQIFARINNDEEMEVRVNGRVVGKYSQTVRVNMENFLKRNAINVISFKFNDEAKSSSYVELSGKFPGDSDFTPIFNFNPKTGKTEGQFEVPFAGKKK